MATPHPSPDGLVRQSRMARLARAAVNAAGLAAIVGAPLAAVTLWLLLTDPATAGEVLEQGNLMPVVTALANAVVHVVSAVLAYL
ncbi:MAG: hypothetical protein AB7O67_20640 [Vicinamibacterales bacterium]